MRASKAEGTGTAGQSAVAGQFEQLGWGVSTNPDHDLGTDLWLMARDARRFDLMLVVGAQVKTSERADSKSKYFKDPVHDQAGDLRGWWFYEANQEHFIKRTRHHHWPQPNRLPEQAPWSSGVGAW